MARLDRRTLCLMALALAGPAAAYAQPAPAKPAEMLKWSMAKYAKLPTFQADCNWNASYGGMPSGMGTSRTIWYKKPNVFKVVTTHPGGRMVQTSVSDGSKLLEFATGIAANAQRYAAPPTIADATTMQMGHPMFCGTLLYKFFGGPDRYAALVDEAKMPVTFGAPVSIDGQACKTVKFWAKGPTYGKTEIAIGTADGLVHRIQYGSEPLMQMMQSSGMKSMVSQALKSPEMQKQIQKNGGGANGKAMQDAMNSMTNLPTTSLTTESYVHIAAGRPIDQAVFKTQAPTTQQVQDFGGGSAPQAPVPLGKPAPAFTVTGLDGVKHKLSEFRGKVVLIDFWATWCPPCRKGLPETQKFYTDYGKRGLAVVTVSDEVKATVQPYLKENKLTFPAYLDPGGAASKAYHVSAIPTVVVIDRNGNLADYKVGLAPREDILAALKKAGLNTR